MNSSKQQQSKRNQSQKKKNPPKQKSQRPAQAREKAPKAFVPREFTVSSAPLAVGTQFRNNRAPRKEWREEENTELIAEIPGSVEFAVTSIALNPGLYATCPWLSQIAQRFESYTFDALEVYFVPSKGADTDGNVMMAIDYDAADAAPIDSTSIMSYRGSIMGKTWENIAQISRQADLKKSKTFYVRPGALASNLDIKTYDTGNLLLATKGQADTSIVGQIFLKYKVRLATEQILISGVGSALYGIFSSTGGSNADPFNTVSGIMPATESSTGTTTAVCTFTFSQPWQGYITVVLSGTGLTTALAISGTALAKTRITEVANTAGTLYMALCQLRVTRGQTMVLTLSNTTITAAAAYFGNAAPVF